MAPQRDGVKKPTSKTEGKGEGGDEAVDAGNNVAVAVVTITVLVLVSILFDILTEVLKESSDEMNMPFINTIFSELTTLGFIGLLLFVITKMDVLSTISLRYLGEKNALQEHIEVLHMGLFLFIIIFLVLCCGLLRLGMLVQREWREFERGASDIPSAVEEYVILTEPPTSWVQRLSLSRWLAISKSRREMVYLALRRRFIDYRSNHPNPETALRIAKEFQVNADIRFPFNEYLSIISGEVMARLIEIDLPTWVALEIILVSVLLVCWQAGENGEVTVLLVCGFLLIILNETVYYNIRRMRRLLTPPRMIKDAERLRLKNEWRAKHNLPLIDVDEKTSMLASADTTDSDFTPPYLDMLPHGGLDMSEADLIIAQKSILGGRGNGVLLALFSTRLVFLLTAMHLSAFIMRVAELIYRQYDNLFVVGILYVLFLLPSIVVTVISVMIARDGLYSFNVEHMKAVRVIVKVMRILKARQTLRTLRFVAEMKIYLREKVRRNSHMPLTDSTKSISTKFSQLAHVASARTRRSLAKRKSLSNRDLSPTPPTSPPLSPLAAYSQPREHRSNVYKLEQERREINTIFCLFDMDGSGAVSKDEMANLLLAITHELDEGHLNRLMSELLANSDRENEISFEAFYQWCHQHIQESSHSKEELIEEIFRMVDTDGSGFITVDEFIAIFKALGQSLDHDDVRELVYQMDRNNDGKIDLEEFSKMLQKHEV
ncbi:TPA: hypothetical protein N0F65_005882 [Lagenidium giganteum]|uniref:EF-hand domain-containing protein n=1 Tax=Lagenidium giganteum TaxID=4803 RepID=A0AAV2YN46_9STRA|nr:TPA: hypothetical protein N0F65_005882 [Lagenidium giganteum]